MDLVPRQIARLSDRVYALEKWAWGSKPPKNTALVYCSFCGKDQNSVEKIIAGPTAAFICAECVDLCAEIVNEAREQKRGFAHDTIVGDDSLCTVGTT